MENEKDKSSWFLKEGIDGEIAVSSRCRAVRNLANFPFPSHFKNDDSVRLQSLIVDAFSKINVERNFKMIETIALSPVNRTILEERGILKTLVQRQKENLLSSTAIFMDDSGTVAATVNASDHLRLFSFSSGLDFKKCYNEVAEIDEKLQERIQFASSYDFGFLSSNLKDLGSGLKFSCRLHLPCAVRFGKLSSIIEYVNESGFSIESAFPRESADGIACGSFFLVQSTNAMRGNEIDQVAQAESVCKFIVEAEQKIFDIYADNKSTVLRNSIIRSFSFAKFSMLLSFKEALEIISDMKLALRMNMISGITQAELCGLLLRVQNGNLSFLLESSSFDFEEDVQKDHHLKIQRLRALVLQEAFENISLGNL